MVTDIDITRKLLASTLAVGMVVEFVGIAGVGKTTLFNEVKKMNFPEIISGDPPRVWKLSSLIFYITHIFQALPTFLSLFFNGHGILTRREIAFVALLHGWDNYLTKLKNKTNKVIVIDQGAISLIAYLRVWSTRGLYGRSLMGWWDMIYDKWSKAIDMVILLDARNEIVLSRINTRPQDHHLKGAPNQFSVDWINKYRNIYNDILNQLTLHNPGLRIIRINSGELSVKQIADQIIPEMMQ